MGFGLNVIPLVTFLVPLVPTFAALFLGFGRYDGYFQDRVIFLFFLGGIGIGALTSILGVGLHLVSPFAFAFAMPLVLELVKTSALNRRKWQGKEHAVFNGAAMGAGVALMWSFALGYRSFQASPEGVTLHLTLGLLLLATGFTAVQFMTGALLGSGVSDRTPFRVVFLGALAGIVPFVALGEYVQEQALLWPALLAGLGVLAFAYARTRLLILGLPAEKRKELRRRSRRGRVRAS